MIVNKVRTDVRQSLNAAPSQGPIPSSDFSLQGRKLLNKQFPIQQLQSNGIRSVLEYRYFSAYTSKDPAECSLEEKTDPEQPISSVLPRTQVIELNVPHSVGRENCQTVIRIEQVKAEDPSKFGE